MKFAENQSANGNILVLVAKGLIREPDDERIATQRCPLGVTAAGIKKKTSRAYRKTPINTRLGITSSCITKKQPSLVIYSKPISYVC
jgi:hypothetical protein